MRSCCEGSRDDASKRCQWRGGVRLLSSNQLPSQCPAIEKTTHACYATRGVQLTKRRACAGRAPEQRRAVRVKERSRYELGYLQGGDASIGRASAWPPGWAGVRSGSVAQSSAADRYGRMRPGRASPRATADMRHEPSPSAVLSNGHAAEQSLATGTDWRGCDSFTVFLRCLACSHDRGDASWMRAKMEEDGRRSGDTCRLHGAGGHAV